MFRRLLDHRQYLFGLLPLSANTFDSVSRDSKTGQSFYDRPEDDETGWDRIRMMFSVDEFGGISTEMNSVNQATFTGLFTGACIGGFIRSRLAYMDFMEKNQATAFKSHLDAKRKLQDSVTVNFAKGAFQWGWRLAAFTGSYVLITTVISVYRGKSSMWEYTAAGCVTGAAYKVNLGLRGLLVGGGLGAVLGTVAGGVSLGLLALSGTSMEEVRFWQYKWKKARKSSEQQMYKQHQESSEPPLIKHHNEKMAATESSKEAITDVARQPATT